MILIFLSFALCFDEKEPEDLFGESYVQYLSLPFGDSDNRQVILRNKGISVFFPSFEGLNVSAFTTQGENFKYIGELGDRTKSFGVSFGNEIGALNFHKITASHINFYIINDNLSCDFTYINTRGNCQIEISSILPNSRVCLIHATTNPTKFESHFVGSKVDSLKLWKTGDKKYSVVEVGKKLKGESSQIATFMLENDGKQVDRTFKLSSQGNSDTGFYFAYDKTNHARLMKYSIDDKTVETQIDLKKALILENEMKTIVSQKINEEKKPKSNPDTTSHHPDRSVVLDRAQSLLVTFDKYEDREILLQNPFVSVFFESTEGVEVSIFRKNSDEYEFLGYLGKDHLGFHFGESIGAIKIRKMKDVNVTLHAISDNSQGVYFIPRLTKVKGNLPSSSSDIKQKESNQMRTIISEKTKELEKQPTDPKQKPVTLDRFQTLHLDFSKDNHREVVFDDKHICVYFPSLEGLEVSAYSTEGGSFEFLGYLTSSNGYQGVHFGRKIGALRIQKVTASSAIFFVFIEEHNPSTFFFDQSSMNGGLPEADPQSKKSEESSMKMSIEKKLSEKKSDKPIDVHHDLMNPKDLLQSISLSFDEYESRELLFSEPNLVAFFSSFDGIDVSAFTIDGDKYHYLGKIGPAYGTFGVHFGKKVGALRIVKKGGKGFKLHVYYDNIKCDQTYISTNEKETFSFSNGKIFGTEFLSNTKYCFIHSLSHDSKIKLAGALHSQDRVTIYSEHQDKATQVDISKEYTNDFHDLSLYQIETSKDSFERQLKFSSSSLNGNSASYSVQFKREDEPFSLGINSVSSNPFSPVSIENSNNEESLIKSTIDLKKKKKYSSSNDGTSHHPDRSVVLDRAQSLLVTFDKYEDREILLQNPFVSVFFESTEGVEVSIFRKNSDEYEFLGYLGKDHLGFHFGESIGAIKIRKMKDVNVTLHAISDNSQGVYFIPRLTKVKGNLPSSSSDIKQKESNQMRTIISEKTKELEKQPTDPKQKPVTLDRFQTLHLDFSKDNHREVVFDDKHICVYFPSLEGLEVSAYSTEGGSFEFLGYLTSSNGYQGVHFGRKIGALRIQKVTASSAIFFVFIEEHNPSTFFFDQSSMNGGLPEADPQSKKSEESSMKISIEKKLAEKGQTTPKKDDEEEDVVVVKPKVPVDDDDETEKPKNPVDDDETEKPKNPVDDDETEKPKKPVDDDETEKPKKPVDDDETEKPKKPVDDDETEKPKKPVDDDETEKPKKPVDDDETEKPKKPVDEDGLIKKPIEKKPKKIDDSNEKKKTSGNKNDQDIDEKDTNYNGFKFSQTAMKYLNFGIGGIIVIIVVGIVYVGCNNRHSPRPDQDNDALLADHERFNHDFDHESQFPLGFNGQPYAAPPQGFPHYPVGLFPSK